MVKVRIGYGFGVRTTLNDDGFGVVVDALEALRFDSLWLSERLGGEAPDPVVGLAYAAGRTKRLKLGMSVLVLPGRNPVVLAKELATLDRLSGGRLLPAFGLGVADPHEQQAFGVERGERARLFDELLAIVRACWTQDVVDHRTCGSAASHPRSSSGWDASPTDGCRRSSRRPMRSMVVP